MPKPIGILFVASEAEPFIGTGILLMLHDAAPLSPIKWDGDKCARLMEAAGRCGEVQRLSG